jgi:hypothetical protein
MEVPVHDIFVEKNMKPKEALMAEMVVEAGTSLLEEIKIYGLYCI